MQIKRGKKENLPSLKDGELGLCTDANELYIGNNGNKSILLSDKLVNNLTTGGADNILSAEQGKMLKEQLDGIEAGITTDDYKDDVADLVAEKIALIKTPSDPTFVDTISECTDTSKIYVLPDGYMYAHHGVENPNLLKIDEVSYGVRLQDEVTGTTTSTASNCVTGWIPVSYKKYYSFSLLINGERTTCYSSGRRVFSRINTKTTSGVEQPDEEGVYILVDQSLSTIRIDSTDVAYIRFNLNTSCAVDDISSKEKLSALQPMIVEGSSGAEASSKAVNTQYVDGGVETISTWASTGLVYQPATYETTIENIQTDVENVQNDITNLKSTPLEQKYNANFVPNDRFIRNISNLRETANAKDFTINITNNSGAVIKNAGIPIGLHNTVGITSANNNMPFQIYDDVFSNPTGFKFFDSDGKECPFYIESESECNYIVDKNIKVGVKTLCILSNGNIITYNATANRMQMSADDGVTWTNICSNITTTPSRVLLPDSQDNLFISATGGQHLYKYTSSDGYLAGTEVLDLEDEETCVGTILAEDSLGNLYSGTYQGSPWKAVVRKSTDHGNTWSVVFTSSDNQHVHNIYVNKNVTPNEIFIGLDGKPNVYNSSQAIKCYVSKDYGATWTLVPVPYYNRDNAFRYAGENFYIGCGERNVVGGATLYKTSDYTDVDAYYPVLDTGQGVRDVTNVIDDSDDVLIAGGCKDDTVHMNQLYLSEDRGETWKTVMIYPSTSYNYAAAGAGLRTFSRKGTQILSQTLTDYPMRFVYGNGAKTTLAIVNVGDIPTTGKIITLKTGYVASIEQMDQVLTAYQNIEGKVADIRVKDGYVIDIVSNKRVLTDATEFVNAKTRIGQTSEYKHLSNASYRLKGSVNLGKLSRLNFCKGFTISMLYKKDDYTLTRDSIDTILQIGTMKLSLDNGSFPKFLLHNGETLQNYAVIDAAYFHSCIDDYVRIVLTVTSGELPVMSVYTNNNRSDQETSTAYTITNNFSTSDFIFGDENMPNISELAIYNRVLSIGEIMSLTNGCNLITNNVEFY